MKTLSKPISIQINFESKNTFEKKVNINQIQIKYFSKLNSIKYILKITICVKMIRRQNLDNIIEK